MFELFWRTQLLQIPPKTLLFLFHIKKGPAMAPFESDYRFNFLTDLRVDLLRCSEASFRPNGLSMEVVPLFGLTV
jgi:hypothetical protein